VFASQLQPTLSIRPLLFAGALALSAALVVPSLAVAAPSASADLSGQRLSSSVVGGPRSGMWRIRVVAPGASERIDFVVRAGDITWNGTVRVSRRVEGRWTVVSRQHLDGTMTALRKASGQAAGVRWNTRNMRLPRNGNSRFAINVELTRGGSYRVVGAVRNAVEAFSYGGWSKVGSSWVSR
jgi:hypothetical protein